MPILFLSIGAQACAQPQAAPPSSASSAVSAAPIAPPPPPPSAPPQPPPPAGPPPATAHAHAHAAHGPSDHAHVYRLDFVLSSKDGAAAATTSFSLILEEGRNGEVVVGKNVPLSPPPANGVTTASPRQDVGLKVKALYHSSATDELLFDIATEMSSYDPPSAIRKVLVNGNAVAAAGKSAVVMRLDDDRKHYELAVTPTKIR